MPDATVTGDLRGLRHSNDSAVLGVFIEALPAAVDILFVSFTSSSARSLGAARAPTSSRPTAT